MIAFMRGTWTPLGTTLIPVSARIGSKARRVLPVAVADEVAGVGPGILQIHHEVAGDLGDPRGGWVRGGAQDPNAAGRVLDDGQDVCRRAREVIVSKQSAARNASAGDRGKVAHVCEVLWGAGSMPASLRISQTVDAASLTPRTRSSPWMRR
jgi:hypothetical protein